MSYLKNPPKFCHIVNGRTYWIGADKCKTLKEYKDYLRTGYGDLCGVKVLELGKDFDAITVIGDYGYPVKDGHYVYGRTK